LYSASIPDTSALYTDSFIASCADDLTYYIRYLKSGETNLKVTPQFSPGDGSWFDQQQEELSDGSIADSDAMRVYDSSNNYRIIMKINDARARLKLRTTGAKCSSTLIVKYVIK